MDRASFMASRCASRAIAAACKTYTRGFAKSCDSKDAKVTRKSKALSEGDGRTLAPRNEPKDCPAPVADDECCALLRADPIAPSAAAPRRRRAHGSGEDRRS
jgi:hypothetical protein